MRLMRSLAVTTAAALAAYVVMGRRRQLRWGATDPEVAATLPGDECVASADLVATRAITVHASPEAVWPWIAQIGRGRGGFYTYDWLENLIGLGIHSADQIVAAWQDVRPGDTVELAEGVGLTVELTIPDRALVISGGISTGDGPAPYDFTWAWVLRQEPDGTTRLVVRERYGYQRWWLPLMLEPVAVISFVMTQRMLRGIRDRAE